jgi:hypothetical protein
MLDNTQTPPILSVLVCLNAQLLVTTKLPDKMSGHVDVDPVASLHLDIGSDLRPPWPPLELEVLCSIGIHSLQLTSACFKGPLCPEQHITEIPMNVLFTCSVLEVHPSDYAHSFLRRYLVQKGTRRAPCSCEVILGALPCGPDYFRWEIAWVVVI